MGFRRQFHRVGKLLFGRRVSSFSDGRGKLAPGKRRAICSNERVNRDTKSTGGTSETLQHLERQSPGRVPLGDGCVTEQSGPGQTGMRRRNGPQAVSRNRPRHRVTQRARMPSAPLSGQAPPRGSRPARCAAAGRGGRSMAQPLQCVARLLPGRLQDWSGKALPAAQRPSIEDSRHQPARHRLAGMEANGALAPAATQPGSSPRHGE